MADFIGEVIGQEKTEEGIVVTIRMTGLGQADGPLMTRAKARAIVVAGLGPKFVRVRKIINKVFDNVYIPGEDPDDSGYFGPASQTRSEEQTAARDPSIVEGPVGAVQNRIDAFRKKGVLTEVLDVTELKTETALPDEVLSERFSEIRRNAASTYEYKILVRTTTSFGV